MAKSQTLHMRIDEELKSNIDDLFNQLGMSTTEAVNIFFRQALLHGGLPFEVKLPRYNEITLKAMEEAKTIALNGEAFDSVEEMYKELGI
ncbi:MAG: type II toxin-antitoxin system RelB/DinJ family antitoxin [Syntrophomonas sp.]